MYVYISGAHSIGVVVSYILRVEVFMCINQTNHLLIPIYFTCIYIHIHSGGSLGLSSIHFVSRVLNSSRISRNRFPNSGSSITGI